MNLKDKLKSELQECQFSLIKEFEQKLSIIIIDHKIALLDAAEAIALDQSEKVKNWMDLGLLKQLDDETLSGVQNDDKFQFIIIQPFLLIQTIF